MSTKSTGNGRTKVKKPSEDKPARKALMIRLDEPLKKKLQQVCATRTKKEGRTVSYNEVVTSLVRGL